jgi:CRP-like cAMP-binding protein
LIVSAQKSFLPQKKETIIAEGDPARYMGIVLSGTIQILRDDYFENRSIVVAAEPSELFGESFACANVLAMPVHFINK